MNINGSDEITNEVSRGKSDGLLRAASITALLAGAMVSVGLTLRSGRTASLFLKLLFVIWVLLPFVALAWANLVSKRWSALTRAALYCVALVITLGSLAIYGGFISPPVGSPHAFVFVAVPLGSWLLMAIVVPITAFISRRRPQRDAGA